MRIPGLRLHDRTDMEVTLACYQMAVEALEKELGLVGSGVEGHARDELGRVGTHNMQRGACERVPVPSQRASIRLSESAGVEPCLPSQPNSTRRDALAKEFGLVGSGVEGHAIHTALGENAHKTDPGLERKIAGVEPCLPSQPNTIAQITEQLEAWSRVQPNGERNE